MNWNDPAERAALLERVGVDEYNRLHAQHRRDSIETTVNGHAIRRVGSRFGLLHAVAGTNRAFATLDQAIAFAVTLARPAGTPPAFFYDDEAWEIDGQPMPAGWYFFEPDGAHKGPFPTEARAIAVRLGDAFARVLKEWLTPDEWAAMRRINTGPDYGPGGACASHNYCDANMAMAEAFRAVFDRELDFEHEASEDLSHVNAAWDYAKTTHLTEHDRFAGLIAEYEAWNKANGLTLGSADEHLHDEDLTEAQRQWLRDFVERWESLARETPQ